MTIKDILAIAPSLNGDTAVWSFAQSLARRRDAYLTGMLVNWLPPMPMLIEGWVVDTRWAEMVDEARVQLEADRQRLATRCAAAVPGSHAEAALIELGAARSVVALRARHADLAIVPRPREDLGETRNALIEAVLFGSGRPAVIVPPDWSEAPVGEIVLVCWNASREAARAVADAVPLLDPAARVIVATIDAQPHADSHGDLPGADIATHLARHGYKVEVRNIDSAGRSDARALMDAAIAERADLMVMGGYGRSRLSEWVFGGVTRDMLAQAPAPLLMSH